MEKDVGTHLFLVQLRSLDDHKVLSGITIGDMGVRESERYLYANDVKSKSGTEPKAMGGYSAVDNGYARFDHVRIPREQMLSGFASVTPDGQYVQPPHAKLSYGGVSIPPLSVGRSS